MPTNNHDNVGWLKLKNLLNICVKKTLSIFYVSEILTYYLSVISRIMMDVEKKTVTWDVNNAVKITSPQTASL